MEPGAQAQEQSDPIVEVMRQAEPCASLPLETRIEALLLTAGRALSESKLAEMLGLEAGSAASIAEAIERLNAGYQDSARAFRAQRVAGGWQLYTLPELAPLVARLSGDHHDSRLSQAALETLSIIAYRQPIMRAEVEAIRGVASGEMLRALLERRMIRIAGRAEQPGRPMLYGTTPQFLKVFGLPGLDALPPVEGDLPRAPAAPQAEDQAELQAGDEGMPDVGALEPPAASP
jgi:segregation and condensation protein B